MPWLGVRVLVDGLRVRAHGLQRIAVQQRGGHAGLLGDLRPPLVLLSFRRVGGVLRFELFDAFGGLLASDSCESLNCCSSSAALLLSLARCSSNFAFQSTFAAAGSLPVSPVAGSPEPPSSAPESMKRRLLRNRRQCDMSCMMVLLMVDGAVSGIKTTRAGGVEWRVQDSNLRGVEQPIYSRPRSASLATRRRMVESK